MGAHKTLLHSQLGVIRDSNGALESVLAPKVGENMKVVKKWLSKGKGGEGLYMECTQEQKGAFIFT